MSAQYLGGLGSELPFAAHRLIDRSADNALLTLQAAQHDPDLLFRQILLASGSADGFDNLLAVALFGSGFLSHLHSSVVTMRQKPSLIK